MAEISSPNLPSFNEFVAPEMEKISSPKVNVKKKTNSSSKPIIFQKALSGTNIIRPLPPEVLDPDKRALGTLNQLYNSPILKAFLAASQRRVF